MAEQHTGEISIVPYTPAARAVWNQLNQEAINGLFLFDRGYLEYHQDRFQDHSLIFYLDHHPVALLPLHVDGPLAASHGGLTFGGLIISARLKIHAYLRVFRAMLGYLQDQGVAQLRYKPIPFIFHRYPALEDQYALYLFGGQLVNRSLSSCLDLRQPVRYTKGRKWSLKRGREANLEMAESQDYPTFMAMVREILEQKYAVTPTHTAAEIALLAQRFPAQIKLLAVFQDNRMIGGTVVYLYDRVVHLQYIATNETGKRQHALDLLLDYLISRYQTEKDYLNFGISPGPDPFGLMTGLIQNKESYGARSLPQDIYQIDLQTLDPGAVI